MVNHRLQSVEKRTPHNPKQSICRSMSLSWELSSITFVMNVLVISYEVKIHRNRSGFGLIVSRSTSAKYLTKIIPASKTSNKLKSAQKRQSYVENRAVTKSIKYLILWGPDSDWLSHKIHVSKVQISKTKKYIISAFQNIKNFWNRSNSDEVMSKTVRLLRSTHML